MSPTTIPSQSESTPNYNVKLVHSTKQNSSEEPIQLAFAVEENGSEQIVTAEVDSQSLFEVCQQNRWLQSGYSNRPRLRKMA